MMMDQYRKGWAFRYLREARAELEAAQKIPYMAPSLVLEAIRKPEMQFIIVWVNLPLLKSFCGRRL
jgi:hypothetical protein